MDKSNLQKKIRFTARLGIRRNFGLRHVDCCRAAPVTRLEADLTKAQMASGTPGRSPAVDGSPPVFL